MMRREILRTVGLTEVGEMERPGRALGEGALQEASSSARFGSVLGTAGPSGHQDSASLPGHRAVGSPASEASGGR